MIEIIEPKRECIKYEKAEKPLDIELLKRKVSAKTFRGLLIGYIQKARKDNNKELEILISEIYKQYNNYHPTQIVKITIVEGWEKGTGDFPMHKDVDNDFVVEIWHKEHKDIKKVPKENINNMLKVIRKLEIGKNYTCYDIAKLMGYEWEYVWQKRMDIYFPLYYIPLKILNELKVIQYGGNKKSIVRLK